MPPERRHTFSGTNLLRLVPRPPVDEKNAIPRAFLDPWNLIVAYPEDPKENKNRQLPCEIAHNVRAAIAETFANEAIGEVADKPFHFGKPPRREGRISNATNTSMMGRIS